MAKKRVDDFKGIKPEKLKAKEDKEMGNYYQDHKCISGSSLLQGQSSLKRTWRRQEKNMHLSFKYFELEDIVPTAIRIFNEVGLIPVVNFTR